ncbi:MAG: serine hydrolase [Desulfobacterales bacterium]|nr:serine hydrolase [Desulfobacterales bacterium]
MTQKIDKLMKKAVADKVFPGAVLLVLKENSVVFFEAYGYANLFSKLLMTKDTVFDLASLTKPLATTLSIMKLFQESKLSLDQNLGSLLPPFKKTKKAQIKIKHLLSHNSGLPDYRPYYMELSCLPHAERKNALRKLLVKESLAKPIGQDVLYSDIGFMILEWIVERIAGKRIDQFVTEKIYRPLDLKNLFFIDLNADQRLARFAATEICPWRKVLLNGVVHDDNAYIVGGVEGHAGLFGDAYDISVLLSALLSAFHGQASFCGISKDLLHIFFKRQEDTDRALGFDTPSLTGSSSGSFFSKNSVGHLGFTGTSFWVDLERSTAIIFLTNRIHPSRANDKIKSFRPKLHDVVMKVII